MRWAVERRDEMEVMLQLPLSHKAADVRKACASQQGTYDLMRHIRLRRMYTVVFWTEDGEAIDEGKDFVIQGGALSTRDVRPLLEY